MELDKSDSDGDANMTTQGEPYAEELQLLEPYTRESGVKGGDFAPRSPTSDV